MEKEVKKLKELVVLLLIILLLVGVYLTYLLYFKSDNKKVVKDTPIVETKENNIHETSEVENTKNYTYKQMAGVYTFKTEKPVSEDGEEYLNLKLQLLSNGLFKYEKSVYVPVGQVGNYIIEGNKIKLNYLFGTNSGVGFSYLSGTKELIINDENSIVDENIESAIVGSFKGTLTRNNDIQGISDFEEYIKGNLHDSSFHE